MFSHCASSFLAVSLALFLVLYWHCPLQKLLLLLFSPLLSLLLLLLLLLLWLCYLKSKASSGRHLFACLKLLLPGLGSFAVRQPPPWFPLSRRSFCQLIHLKFATKSFNVASLNLAKMDNYFNKLCKILNKTCRHSLALSKLSPVASFLTLSLWLWLWWLSKQIFHLCTESVSAPVVSWAGQVGVPGSRSSDETAAHGTRLITHNSTRRKNFEDAACRLPYATCPTYPHRSGLTDLPRLLPTF